jgi:hypothetical protein
MPMHFQRPELNFQTTQLAREGSPPPRLRLAQVKLPRNSNQISCARIWRFESYMPSHAVGLRRANMKSAPLRHAARRRAVPCPDGSRLR